MKKIIASIVVVLAVAGVMYGHFHENIKSAEPKNIVPPTTPAATISVASSDVSNDENALCSKEENVVVSRNLAAKRKQLQENASEIYRHIHKLHINNASKETLLQSLGNDFDIDDYRSETSWHKNIHYSTLTPVLGKPASLKGETRQIFINALNSRNYREISSMFLNKTISNQSTYGGKTVLSAVIAANPAVTTHDISQLIASGAQPNLYDVKTAISAGLSTDLTEYLIRSGTVDLPEAWYENNANYNILTYAASIGRLEHALMLYSNYGVSLAIEHDYTLVDVIAKPSADQQPYAERLIDAFIKAGLKPYKNNSITHLAVWLDEQRIKQLTDIDNMARKSMSLDDVIDKYLTIDRRKRLEQLSSAHHDLYRDVSFLNQQLTKCVGADASTETLAAASSSIAMPQELSRIEQPDTQAIAQKYSQEFITTMPLIQSKKYDDALAVIDNIVNSSGETVIYDLYLNALISGNADSSQLQKIIQRGGKLSAESIFIMIYSNHPTAINIYNEIHPNTKVKTPDGQTPLEFALMVDANSDIITQLRKNTR